MKKILNKIIALPLKRKLALTGAIILTITFCAMIPAYAWFSSQRKAAEAFKIKYPNSLFVNAAYREDRKFFDLDEIDVTEGNGHRYYVFSVSGESTTEFILQMAHTNNNGFTYKIYTATEQSTEAGSDASHELHANAADPDNVAYNENKPENTLAFDEVTSRVGTKMYYVKGSEIPVTYLNLVDQADPNRAKIDVNDVSFFETYGSNTNVQQDSVPTYCQANITTHMDLNTKLFCEYFILEVSWGATQQNTKETDLVYFSVKRVN